MSKPRYCLVDMCYVPVPHKHRPPTEAEVAESIDSVEISHPSHCAWRKDVYDGCSCGVTGLVTQLYDAMRERESKHDHDGAWHSHRLLTKGQLAAHLRARSHEKAS